MRAFLRWRTKEKRPGANVPRKWNSTLSRHRPHAETRVTLHQVPRAFIIAMIMRINRNSGRVSPTVPGFGDFGQRGTMDRLMIRTITALLHACQTRDVFVVFIFCTALHPALSLLRKRITLLSTKSGSDCYKANRTRWMKGDIKLIFFFKVTMEESLKVTPWAYDNISGRCMTPTSWKYVCTTIRDLCEMWGNHNRWT
jgi:hypothetical protein